MIQEVKRKEIALLYSNGKTSSEIARQKLCSPTTVCKVAKENNITIRGYGWISEDERQQIITHYLREESVAKIAEEFRRGQTTIRNILKKDGFRLRIHTKCRILADTEVEKAINLYYAGHGIKEISKMIDCGYSFLRNTFIRKGIKIRTPHEASCLRVNRINPNWGLGRKKVRDGYIEVWAPEHPRANKMGYVREHILVWEKAHKQPLPQGYIVHHFNGIRDDNQPGNLFALPKKLHNSSHLRHARLKDMFIRKLQERIRELEAGYGQKDLFKEVQNGYQ